jgi:hypothetical protein
MVCNFFVFLVSISSSHDSISQALKGYIPYGNGQFDGQGSGHDAGTDWHPSQGGVNNCDGERSHLACDVRSTFTDLFLLVFAGIGTMMLSHMLP